MTERRKKVVVGLSGGVDSSVAASLLVDQGYEVVGAFMKNWSETKDPVTGECAWRQERDDAMRVAADLGIPFITFDFEKEYDQAVVQYLFDEYAKGRTPNPDVMCNRAVKFDLFLREALKMGADFIATGHYARVDMRGNRYRLLAGADSNKDQSYFVFSLGQEQLKHVLFPIGHLTKPEVRAYAKSKRLHIAEKKDSQGICFIGKVELGEFLKRSLKPKPGKIVDIDGGVIGTHPDVHAFTVGQRHGLGVGGGVPYFVVSKDIETAQITVARGENHQALFKSELEADEWHWVSGHPPAFPLTCRTRIRYRQPLQNCAVKPPSVKIPSEGKPSEALTFTSVEIASKTEVSEGKTSEGLVIYFERPQRAVAPGQFVVLYDADEVLGGGVIR